MALLDPAGAGPRVISGGTYSGNPLSATAGLATLNKLTPAMHVRLDAMGQRMREGLNRIFRAAQQQAQASGDGSLFQIVPTDRPLTNYRDVPQDAKAFAWLDRLHLGLLQNGVIISHRGLGCVSSPMGEAEVDDVLAAFERVLAGMRN
jgi:glutamate-1-semialdehyde 2,1-aminomutase